MNARFWIGVIATAVATMGTVRAQTALGSPGTAPVVSSAAADVVKMAEGGTSEDVLLAYVQNSSASFDLSADQILYLRDIGVPSTVISAMLNRDANLKDQSLAAQPAPETLPAAPAEAPAQVTAPLVPEPAVAPAPAPVYVSNPPEVVSYFYNDLAPYGTWVQLDGAGWCWQPRVGLINPDWRPYCDSGHWVDTDAGWCWQSYYSWGWAPFHYGRWFLQDGCGWVWAPDRVWGPGWVSWRSGGDTCGWAPLPPHADFDLNLGYCFNGVHVGFDFDFGLRPQNFTFIALHDFEARDYAHHRLDPTQVTRIYNHTTVLNNYVVNNNTIVNRGIRADRVAAATHTEVHRLPIRDVPAWSAGSPGHGLAKTELVVYRPQLKPGGRPINMVAQKIDAQHPTTQRLPLASPTSSRAFAPSTSPSLAMSSESQHQTRVERNATGAWANRSTSSPPVRQEPAVPSGFSKTQHMGAFSQRPVNEASTAGYAANHARSIVASTEQRPTPAPHPIAPASQNISQLPGNATRFNSQYAHGFTDPSYRGPAATRLPARDARFSGTQNRGFAQESPKAQVQLPRPPTNQGPQAQPAWQWPQTTTFSPRIPSAAGVTQYKTSTPVARVSSSGDWPALRQNHYAAAPRPVSPAPQYYAHAQERGFGSSSYTSSQAFRPQTPREYSRPTESYRAFQPSVRTPEFRAPSRPAAPQGNAGHSAPTDFYKHGYHN